MKIFVPGFGGRFYFLCYLIGRSHFLFYLVVFEVEYIEVCQSNLYISYFFLNSMKMFVLGFES